MLVIDRIDICTSWVWRVRSTASQTLVISFPLCFHDLHIQGKIENIRKLENMGRREGKREGRGKREE
jgi:hypothetical protein